MNDTDGPDLGGYYEAMYSAARQLAEDAGVPERLLTRRGDDLAAWLLACFSAERRHVRQLRADVREGWMVEENDAADARLVEHDPVMADLDAKERLVHALWFAGQVAEVRDAAGGVIAGGAEAVNDALKLLALKYAGRPGYRPEWRPE